MRIWKRKFCFIDIETSSLQPDAEILEIAGLMIQPPDFSIIEEFDYLVKMEQLERSNQECLRVIGYSEQKWAAARDLREVLLAVQLKVKGTVLIGFRSDFDWSRLERAFFDHGLADPFYKKHIDIFPLALMLVKENVSERIESLTEFCEFFDVERGQAHRALDDVRAAYNLFLRLLEKFPK